MGYSVRWRAREEHYRTLYERQCTLKHVYCTYFRRILSSVLNLELSSGALSDT